MTITESSRRVFISYDRDDIDYARKMFRELKASSYEPWLDCESLLPGQRWESKIEQAMRESHYILALMSTRSSSKRGYVQKEIRKALDLLEEIPEGDIFLIPARIDECEPTHSALRGVQWVDLFPDWEAGVERIIRALKSGGAVPAASISSKRRSQNELVSPMDMKGLNSPIRDRDSGSHGPQRVRILFLGANSLNSPLELDKEVRRIQISLRLAKERDNLELKQEWAVTVDTLMQAMLDESPTIVHFSGHGKESGIILQDEIDEPKVISTDALLDLFKLFKDTVRCVVLNSCYSETQARAIRRYIPYVIGIRSGIPDSAAVAFATGFYKALGAGKDIPFAFELGKTSIRLEGFLDENLLVLL